METPAARKRPERAAVLVNAVAGTAETKSREELSRRLADLFAQYGIQATIELVDRAGLIAGAERAIGKAKAREIDLVVAGGGDGTISSVVGLLAETGIPLGVLPLGTLNHFAKDLGIPLDLEEAVKVIATGAVKAVDLGQANGRIFMNNSSIGVYPQLVMNRERRRRHGHPNKWVAMILAFGHMLRHFRLAHLRIRTEDGVEPYRTPCLFVSNNKYELDILSPPERGCLNAGELWLAISKHSTRLSLFWFSCRALLGIGAKASDLRMLSVAEAEITTRKHRLLLSFDGELEVMHPPIRYRIMLGALRVIAPLG